MKDRVTVKEIASDLDYSEIYVRDVITKRPDFPKPYRIGNRMWWTPKEYESWKNGLKQ